MVLEDPDPADCEAELKPKDSEVPYWKNAPVESPRGLTIALRVVALSVVDVALPVVTTGAKDPPPEPTVP